METVVNDVYIVKPYDPNIIDCCVYLVDTKSDDGLILIDAGVNFEPIQDIEKEGFRLKDIKHCLITHGHLDHYGACHRLIEFNKDIKFYAHQLDADKIEQKPTEPIPIPSFANYEYEPIKLTKKISLDNKILEFGNLKFQCIHMPGHTPGSIGYLLDMEGSNILFGGDIPGIAINLNDGSVDQYVKSMEKLLTLNIDILCEGHENITKPADKVSKCIKGYINFNEKLNFLLLENRFDKNAMLNLVKVSYELEWYDVALDFCKYLLEIDPNNAIAQQMHKKIKKHKPPETGFFKRLITQIHGKEE